MGSLRPLSSGTGSGGCSSCGKFTRRLSYLMCFRKLPLEGDNSISQSLCRWASTGVLHTVKSPCPQDIMLLFESIWLSFHLFYRPPPLYAKGGTFPRLTLHTQHGTLSQTLSECFFNSFHPSCISKLMTYVSHSVLTHTFCTFSMCWELQQDPEIEAHQQSSSSQSAYNPLGEKTYRVASSLFFCQSSFCIESGRTMV